MYHGAMIKENQDVHKFIKTLRFQTGSKMFFGCRGSTAPFLLFSAKLGKGTVDKRYTRRTTFSIQTERKSMNFMNILVCLVKGAMEHHLGIYALNVYGTYHHTHCSILMVLWQRRDEEEGILHTLMSRASIRHVSWRHDQGKPKCSQVHKNPSI